MKEDRRVRKTKKALRDGLVELLSEKNIQNITVRELTDKVDIHRSTFYANFKDIYDLFSHMEDAIIQEISEILLVDCDLNPQVFFEYLCGYINDNKQVARLFFGGNICTAFYDRLTGLFREGCIDCWRKDGDGASLDVDYYVQFCLSGGLGVVGMWVASDFVYPVEKVVAVLASIDAKVGEIFISVRQ